MFSDHNGVHRSRIFESEESKTSRLAIRIPDDRAGVDFAELGKVISQALWCKKNKRKESHAHPHHSVKS
jgi:hypothetical protein